MAMPGADTQEEVRGPSALAAAHVASTRKGPARAPGDLAELLGLDVDELAGAFA
jgi:hypothetical protein